MHMKQEGIIMKYTENEVLRFVTENDVKFIRLAFCDIFGNQKNISVMPRELARAFELGIPFQANLIDGFVCGKENELRLVPDPATMAILPWRPQTGRVVRFFCHIKNLDGSDYEFDARYLLRIAAKRLEEKNLECFIRTECEFYLFQTDEDGLPTKIPHDNATYFDIAPKDKAENVRREICLSLEQMGIAPETSHHQRGPGQNEIVYKYSSAVSSADDFVTYKSVVKTIANKNGLYASFMPKPLTDFVGNQMIIDLFLYQDEENQFSSHKMNPSADAAHFAAGILKYLRELSLFLFPSANSYQRLNHDETPKIIKVSDHTPGAALRVDSSESDQSKLILRITDSCCNPYLVFGLLLNAGIAGIEQQITLADDDQFFANNLSDAIQIAKSSDFVASILPHELLKLYLNKKEAECSIIADAQDIEAIETELYFEQF